MMGNEIVKIPLITVRRIRYMLVGAAILTIVAFISSTVATETVQINLSYFYSILKSLGFILFPYLPLVVLTYASPDYGGRHTTLLLGGVLFLLITIPFELWFFIMIIIGAGIEDDMVPPTFVLVNLLQWLVVLLVLSGYIIVALYKRSQPTESHVALKDSREDLIMSSNIGQKLAYYLVAFSLYLFTLCIINMALWPVPSGVLYLSEIIVGEMDTNNQMDIFYRTHSLVSLLSMYLGYKLFDKKIASHIQVIKKVSTPVAILIIITMAFGAQLPIGIALFILLLPHI